MWGANQTLALFRELKKIGPTDDAVRTAQTKQA